MHVCSNLETSSKKPVTKKEEIRDASVWPTNLQNRPVSTSLAPRTDTPTSRTAPESGKGFSNQPPIAPSSTSSSQESTLSVTPSSNVPADSSPMPTSQTQLKKLIEQLKKKLAESGKKKLAGIGKEILDKEVDEKVRREVLTEEGERGAHIVIGLFAVALAVLSGTGAYVFR